MLGDLRKGIVKNYENGQKRLLCLNLISAYIKKNHDCLIEVAFTKRWFV